MSLELCFLFFQSLTFCESLVRLVENDAGRSLLLSWSVCEPRVNELAELLRFVWSMLLLLLLSCGFEPWTVLLRSVFATKSVCKSCIDRIVIVWLVLRVATLA